MSLDPDGSKRHGVAFDHMRLLGLAARAAAAAGTPLDANRLPPALMQPRMVIIAVPIVCGADRILPESVALADARGNTPPSAGTAIGDKIASLSQGLPGMADAIAVAYTVPNLIAGARALREQGAREVWVYVTHALLSREGLARLAGAEDISGIVVTDTVPIDPREQPENLTVLTVAPLLAETIVNVFSDDSVSAIFGGENQLF